MSHEQVLIDSITGYQMSVRPEHAHTYRFMGIMRRGKVKSYHYYTNAYRIVVIVLDRTRAASTGAG